MLANAWNVLANVWNVLANAWIHGDQSKETGVNDIIRSSNFFNS